MDSYIHIKRIKHIGTHAVPHSFVGMGSCKQRVSAGGSGGKTGSTRLIRYPVGGEERGKVSGQS